ncbi:MAG TPA: hypothetical protein VGF99_04130 [Myxococcota bacterium]
MRFVARSLFTIVAVVVVAACASTPDASPTPVPAVDSSTAQPPEVVTSTTLPDDGLPSWTTAGRQYAGPPLGGRGGRYLIDVCPDGTYAYLLLDAWVRGTWTPGEGGLVLTHNGGGGENTSQLLALSANGQQLGEMTYVGPPSCSAE